MKLKEYVLGGISCLLMLAFACWIVYSAVTDVARWAEHRMEPVYLIARWHDPIDSTRPSAWCGSPARMDRTPGWPNLDCLIFVKEYELVELGLDPAQHIPYNEEWEERVLHLNPHTNTRG